MLLTGEHKGSKWLLGALISSIVDIKVIFGYFSVYASSAAMQG